MTQLKILVCKQQTGFGFWQTEKFGKDFWIYSVSAPSVFLAPSYNLYVVI